MSHASLKLKAEKLGILTVQKWNVYFELYTLTMCQWRGRTQCTTLLEIQKDSQFFITWAANNHKAVS